MHSFCLCKEICADICVCSEILHFYLQQPLKQQTLRNISILNRRLYDVCELENSIDEMLLPTTPFVTSFQDGLELSSQP